MDLHRVEADQDETLKPFLAGASRHWHRAMLVAELFAIDPAAFGGVVVLGRSSPARERWLEVLTDLTGENLPAMMIPGTVGVDALNDSFDPVAALVEDAPVAAPGFLRRARGRLVVVQGAERLTAASRWCLAREIDRWRPLAKRGGQGAADFGVSPFILLDESEEEVIGSDCLRERLAFTVSLDDIPVSCTGCLDGGPRRVAKARQLFTRVEISDKLLRSLCSLPGPSAGLSLHRLYHATRIAKACAALEGRMEVRAPDIELARSLLAEPAMDIAEETTPPTEHPESREDGSGKGAGERVSAGDGGDGAAPSAPSHDEGAEEITIEAASSGAVDLDETGTGRALQRVQGSAGGRGGQAASPSKRGRGRPVGAERGDPRRGRPLDLPATLRAAAPWQKIRPRGERALTIYPSDFRVKKYIDRPGSSVIFIVDASGSSAMHRLAETKGAVEALLRECYSRRDRVALIAFKGSSADKILAPSRSLTRARRAMAELPGGGGTPLASALEAGVLTALQEKREGNLPLLVLLTDGQANIDLQGKPGRNRALEDAKALAQTIAAEKLEVLFFDTSKRPSDRARHLCALMHARYIPLPHADSRAVSATVGEERKRAKAQGQL